MTLVLEVALGTLIYIGNYADMDVSESNSTIDNEGAVTGSYSAGDMQNVEVDISSNSGNGYAYDDDYGRTPDDFTYDVGNGEVSSGLDSEARFAGTITDGDGNTHSVTMSVYQTQNGDTFVKLPNGYDVSEVTISHVVGDGYSGIWTSASSDSTVVCFHVGTCIQTPGGPTAIEQLHIGDEVMTLDRGVQKIRWMDFWEVQHTTRVSAPITIAPGALGNGLPKRTLKVSPQHRILIRSAIAARMFDTEDVLVPAIQLLGFPGIAQQDIGPPATYAHIMCARHELVNAEGVAAETLLLADQAIQTLQATGKTIAPDVDMQNERPVRAIQEGKRLTKWAERHRKNAKPMIAVAGPNPDIPVMAMDADVDMSGLLTRQTPAYLAKSGHLGLETKGKTV